MSNLELYSGGTLARDARRASRQISGVQARTEVRRVIVQAETDLALDKLDAITGTTGQAMGCVIRVAQAQRQLESLAPEAAGRLAYLADGHVMAAGAIVDDLATKVRRL